MKVLLMSWGENAAIFDLFASLRTSTPSRLGDSPSLSGYFSSLLVRAEAAKVL